MSSRTAALSSGTGSIGSRRRPSLVTVRQPSRSPVDVLAAAHDVGRRKGAEPMIEDRFPGGRHGRRHAGRQAADEGDVRSVRLKGGRARRSPWRRSSGVRPRPRTPWRGPWRRRRSRRSSARPRPGTRAGWRATPGSPRAATPRAGRSRSSRSGSLLPHTRTLTSARNARRPAHPILPACLRLRASTRPRARARRVLSTPGGRRARPRRRARAVFAPSPLL